MIDVIKVASYIYKRYKDETNTEIDEMKLHKLLYFSQRESIIRTGQLMFKEQFEAWKYGPVIVKVRDKYKAKALNEMPTEASWHLTTRRLILFFRIMRLKIHGL